MATIRLRLTFWYTVALAVTVLAFGTALYIERRQASVRELDQRLTLEGGEQNPAASAHRLEHLSPIGFELGRSERQDEPDRGAAEDGIAQQQGELLQPRLGISSLKPPDHDRRVGLVQVGRPSIG